MATAIKYIGACLLLLCSCARSSHWSSNEIHSRTKEHDSSKLSYHSRDRAHGIDVEFLKTKDHLNVYLNVHSIPIPASPSKTASLKLELEGKILTCEAYRMEGGQRLRLPEEIATLLIESLKNHNDVILTLPGYRTTIMAEDFSKKFHRLHHPRIQNPLHFDFLVKEL